MGRGNALNDTSRPPLKGVVTNQETATLYVQDRNSSHFPHMGQTNGKKLQKSLTAVRRGGLVDHEYNIVLYLLHTHELGGTKCKSSPCSLSLSFFFLYLHSDSVTVFLK